MKILAFLLLSLLTVSCQMVSLKTHMNTFGLGGINSVDKLSAEGLNEDINKRNNKYRNFYQSLPVKTTAQIKRGEQLISIDLAKATDVAKIEAKDVILLEEGNYKTLPEIKAVDVVIEGISKDKTLIGDFSTNHYTNIRGERLFLSRLAIYNAYFADTVYQEGDKHSYYLLSQARVIGGTFQHQLYGPNISPFATVNIFFSEIYDNMKDSKWSMEDDGYYSYFENYGSGNRKLTYFSENVHGRAREYASSLDDEPINFKPSALYDIALKNYEANKFLEIYPETIKAFQDQIMETHASYLASQSSWRDPNIVFAFQFFERNYAYKVSDEKLNEINNYTVIAKEANQKKRYLTATLAAAFQHERLSLMSNSESGTSLFKQYLTQAANKYSCTRKIDFIEGAREEEEFFNLLTKKYPILTLNALDSECKLTYVQNINKKDIYTRNQGVSSTPIMAETLDSQRRSAAIRRATTEATEAKWKAQAALSADRLSQAGTIFKRSHATFGKVGNVDYMVYGKGTYSPKDDPLLKYNEKLAEHRLKEVNKMTSGKEMEQIDTITTKSYYAVNQLNYEATLSAIFSNGKKALIKGPLATYALSKYCELNTINNGAKIASFDSRDCKTNEIGFDKYVASYDRDNIMYYFEEAFYENEMAKNVTIASQYIHSSDPKDQLEGQLMALGLNLNVDYSKLSQLTEALFGRPISKEVIYTRILKKY